MSAYTNGVPTLSQLAESGLITTWQARPPPRTKGRCHFINLLWPRQRVNSPSKTKKKKKKTCHYCPPHHYNLSLSFLLPSWTPSLYELSQPTVKTADASLNGEARYKEGGMETQSVMMIPLVIYNQMRLRPCGSLLDYPSREDCQVLTPPRFYPPTHCGLVFLHHHHRHALFAPVLLCNLQSHLQRSL